MLLVVTQMSAQVTLQGGPDVILISSLDTSNDSHGGASPKLPVKTESLSIPTTAPIETLMRIRSDNRPAQSRRDCHPWRLCNLVLLFNTVAQLLLRAEVESDQKKSRPTLRDRHHLRRGAEPVPEALNAAGGGGARRETCIISPTKLPLVVCSLLQSVVCNPFSAQ